MDSDAPLPLKKEVTLPDEQKHAQATLEDSVTDIAFNALCESQQYKQLRMDKIRLYERMYYNDIPPRYRQIHNVIVPVFPGLVDSMLADFNDEMQLKFKESKPSDYLTIPKIQAHWEGERDSLEPNAKWNYKARADRFNAVLSGRRIMQNYAESDPEYRNVLEVINYTDFHCQAIGGGDLENHLFVGREGIMRTLESIWEDESYPKEQREKIKNFAWSSDMWTTLETTYGTKLQRFMSQGLDPESNGWKGNRTVNLCRFGVTYKGRRFMVLFEPLTKIWLSVSPWDKKWPWKSAATHEDHKLFWSKAFADDFYYIAELVNILISEEVTNREKANNQSRAVDPKMFPDMARLDSAQYEPGTIVPFNSMPDGVTVRRAAEGVYDFTVPGLNGTIELSQALVQMLEKYTGAGQLDIPKGTKPAVVVQLQQQRSKRIGLRTDGMKEMDSELGLSYFEGLKEHMPSKVSVRILGENGFIDEQQLSRIEVNSMGTPTVKVVSGSEEENADNMKRDARVKAIEMLTQNPNLNSFEKEIILRDIGQFDEAQIAFAVENIPYTARKQIAHASKTIQSLLLNKEPEIYYGADVSYQRYIYNYVIDHKSDLKTKFPRFFAHLKMMQPIFEQNATQQGQKQNQQQMLAKAQANAGTPNGKPSPKPSASAPMKSATQGVAQDMGITGALA